MARGPVGVYGCSWKTTSAQSRVLEWNGSGAISMTKASLFARTPRIDLPANPLFSPRVFVSQARIVMVYSICLIFDYGLVYLLPQREGMISREVN
jgi:hypothetical protein